MIPRKSPRASVDYACTIKSIGSGSYPVEFRVYNLSLNGLRATPEQPNHGFRKSSLVEVSIWTEDETLKFLARPCWGTKSYELGFQIVQIESGEQQKLEYLMDRLT